MNNNLIKILHVVGNNFHQNTRRDKLHSVYYNKLGKREYTVHVSIRQAVVFTDVLIVGRLDVDAQRPYLDIFKAPGSPCHELTSSDNSTSMGI